MNSSAATELSGSVQNIEALIRDLRIAIITTVAEDGMLHTRPLAVQRHPTLDQLWFFTAADSAKAEEIGSTHEVSLGFFDPKYERYVAISGTAQILHDVAKAQELWNPWVEVWFPGGPTDPMVRLVQVTPHRAEYWDGRSHRMSVLYQVAQVALDGRSGRPEGGHPKMKLPL